MAHNESLKPTSDTKHGHDTGYLRLVVSSQFFYSPLLLSKTFVKTMDNDDI